MNQRTSRLFNIEKLQQLLNDPALLGHVFNPFKIFRMRGSWTLESRPQSEQFRLTFGTRELHADFSSTSYGYNQI